MEIWVVRFPRKGYKMLKVIIEKSRGEGYLMFKYTIENVS
jgi:hypothetical protein